LLLQFENLFFNKAANLPHKLTKTFNEISGEWIKGYKQTDDITILVIKMKELITANVSPDNSENLIPLQHS
jgi:hypothetical protein